MTNYAAPGSHVGLQVDGDVTITGGLFIDMGDRPGPGCDDPGPGDDGETTWIQDGPLNVATGNEIVAVQGEIRGTS